MNVEVAYGKLSALRLKHMAKRPLPGALVPQEILDAQREWEDAVALAKAPQPRVEPEGKVYVLGCGRFVKIGFTAGSVASRARHLQTGSPHPIEVLASFKAPMSTETALHRRFAAYRTSGEWFLRDGAVADWIEGGCAL